MSLFKAREWWSCQVGSGEQFDSGCLKVGSLLNEPNGTSRTSMQCSMLLLCVQIRSSSAAIRAYFVCTIQAGQRPMRAAVRRICCWKPILARRSSTSRSANSSGSSSLARVGQALIEVFRVLALHRSIKSPFYSRRNSQCTTITVSRPRPKCCSTQKDNIHLRIDSRASGCDRARPRSDSRTELRAQPKSTDVQHVQRPVRRW